VVSCPQQKRSHHNKPSPQKGKKGAGYEPIIKENARFEKYYQVSESAGKGRDDIAAHVARDTPILCMFIHVYGCMYLGFACSLLTGVPPLVHAINLVLTNS